MDQVLQFRVAVTVDDFEKALLFYRDALGIPVQQEWTSAHGRGVVLSIKEATLEILDQAHAEMVDTMEVGERVAGQIRFAFQVPDVRVALKSATGGGGRLVNGPVETPWKDLNARLVSPEGIQVTLFQAPSKPAI